MSSPKPGQAFAAVMVLLASISLSCGNARRAGPASAQVQVASDPNLASGQVVFMRNCYQCHPGGQAGLGPAINNKPLPGFMIKTQVRLGVGAMPGFSKEDISDEELDRLVTYLHDLRKRK